MIGGDFMSIVGDRIHQLRLRYKLTLDDVAKHINVGKQAVYKYEKGTVTNIPLDKIDKMAQLFNVSPGYLSGWSDNEHDDDIQIKLNLHMFSGPEQDLLSIFRNLSDEGQKYLLQQAHIASQMFAKKNSPAEDEHIG